MLIKMPVIGPATVRKTNEKTLRVLVCGSRHYGQKLSEYDSIMRKINQLSLGWPKSSEDEDGKCLPNVFVVAGGATGVDTVAINWAVFNGCEFEEFPISKQDWQRLGRAAGPIRNQRMLDEGKPDLVVAFLAEDSRGTRDMVDRSKKAGVPVEIIPIEIENPP